MLKFQPSRAVFVLLIAVLAGALAHADVRLPGLVGDNMVLQQGQALKIWGWADAGEKVTVSFNGQTANATTDAQGNWLAPLPAMAAGGPFDMTIAGKNSLTLKNVMLGEVWVCSGQSNMAFTTNGVINAQDEMAKADFPNIRLFTVPRVTATEAQTDAKGQWKVCTPQTVGGFSAVGYFLGRNLFQKLNVPIGLIDSSWGGTCAEAWTTVPTLKADADYNTQFANWDKAIADYPAAMEKYKTDMEAWKVASEKAKAAGQPQPRQPYAPNGPLNPNRPGNLYYGMIAPLVNYTIRGAIWYQGESNAGRAYMYRKLLPTMIGDWRKAWGSDFPFYIVQLANFMPRKDQPGDSAWAELREAQTMTAKLPHNGMAVIIDVGDAADIHPRDKQTVGYRLALQALGHAYGKDVPCDSPQYASMSVAGRNVTLRFANSYAGLVSKDDKFLHGFAIAGADKKFYWASAHVKGDTVIVHSRFVKQPVAVRYAWADNPECNLYNSAGLPAIPFRTDDWPGVTINAR
jgi:sialate O-acetylesterase